jgi:hypothetical protein
MELIVAFAALLFGILIGIGVAAWSTEPRRSGKRRSF